MKTITEFSGFTLKDSITKKSAMIAEGKTEEEAQTSINELLKLTDETKVAFYKNAVDMSKSRIDQVKRVVVAEKSSETEKVPESFMEREGKFYLLEYFPQASSPHRGNKEERFGRGRDRNDRGARSERNERSDRRPRPERSAEARPVQGEAKPQGERKPRPPRGPKPAQSQRPPRAPRPQQGPKGAAELRLVLKGQGPATLQGSTPAPVKTATESSGSDTQPVSS